MNATLSNRICKICGNAEANRSYRFQEAMFGLSESFEYFDCSRCGCLQIAEIPDDPGKYYPANYYSLHLPSGNNAGGLRHRLTVARNRYCLSHRGILGKALDAWHPNETMRLIGRVRLHPGSKILDVGCGSGALLSSIKAAGYTHVLGIDPFLDHDVRRPDGLELRKVSIHDVGGTWDLIMYHHSFEHIDDPLAQLKSVSGLLSTEGVCLIRIPTVSSYAWQRYGTHWAQLDPPRHFFLHSPESLEILAGRAGLRCEMTVYDSDEFQFWGSEEVARGIPLESERSYLRNKSASMFSARAIAEFKKKARALNELGWGDQAGFFLRRMDASPPPIPRGGKVH